MKERKRSSKIDKKREKKLADFGMPNLVNYGNTLYANLMAFENLRSTVEKQFLNGYTLVLGLYAPVFSSIDISIKISNRHELFENNFNGRWSV